MNPKTKWYCWSTVVSVIVYVLLAWEMNRELHCWAKKEYATMFFFPLGIAVLVSTALNLRFMKPSAKRYSVRMIFGMIAYVLALDLINHIPMPSSPWKYLLVLLPVLPLVYVCNTIVRAVLDMDEMKRKIATEAMAFTGLATGFTCFSYLFLRDMGAPEFRPEWAFYIMWIYYGIGTFFSWRRYM